MNKYKILFQRDDCGHIIIEAETAEKARQQFEEGYYDDRDLEYKNGGVQFEGIEKI